jgi:hypothetical protein
MVERNRKAGQNPPRVIAPTEEEEEEEEEEEGSRINISTRLCVCVGRNSSVGIATRYGLDGPGIESRGWGGGDIPHLALGPN